jgi:hypothetical protein
MALVEAFHEGGGHGRYQAPWAAMGAHPEREGRGKGKEERGALLGGGGMGAIARALGARPCFSPPFGPLFMR